jgi:hypothetical protein
MNVGDKVWIQAWEHTKDPAARQVGEQVEDQVWDQVWFGVADPVLRKALSQAYVKSNIRLREETE